MKKMRNSGRSDSVFYCLILAVIFSSSTTFTRAGNDTSGDTRQCDITDASVGCKKYERCVQTSQNGVSVCQCLKGYEFVRTSNGSECVQVTTPSSVDPPKVKPETNSKTEGSSVAMMLLFWTFLTIGGVVTYFAARRYKLLQRIRQYRQNRYGNVLVTRDDDDDDDPPIA